MKGPLISVVIPTHKRPILLVRAIKSVLKQTYKHIEMIIVDDASQNSTKQTVVQLQKDNSHVNIIYLSNKTQMGACFCRNKGIQFAKGEFVTGLDDDDEFKSNRIEVLLKEYDDSFAFICSDILVQKKDGVKILKSKKTISFSDLLWTNIVGSQVLVRRERLLENLYDETLTSAQDYDLWLRLIKEYGCAKRIPIPLYIQHTEHDLPRISTSRSRIRGYYMVFIKYKRFMNIKQRSLHLINILRIKNKKIPVFLFLNLYPNYYFFQAIYRATLKKYI
jgi:glycosyltransferase involved in cell wall biosynthesis